MTLDPFERVAERFIGAEKEVKDLFPAPKITAPQQFPFTDYFQKKRGEPPVEPVRPRVPPRVPPVEPPPEPPPVEPPPEPPIVTEKVSEQEARAIYKQRQREIDIKYRLPQSWEFKDTGEEARQAFLAEEKQAWEEYQANLPGFEQSIYAKIARMIAIPFEIVGAQTRQMLIGTGDISQARVNELVKEGRIQPLEPYENLPFWEQLLWETPAFLNIYRQLGRLTIGGVKLIGRGAVKASLNTGLDKWIAAQARLPVASRSPLYPFVSRTGQVLTGAKNKNTFVEAVTNSFLRRQGRTPNKEQAIREAIDEVVNIFVPRGTQTGIVRGGLPAERLPTIQSVVAKITNNLALTTAERQLYANQSQAVEAALQAQVTPPVTPPVTPEVTKWKQALTEADQTMVALETGQLRPDLTVDTQEYQAFVDSEITRIASKYGVPEGTLRRQTLWEAREIKAEPLKPLTEAEIDELVAGVAKRPEVAIPKPPAVEVTKLPPDLKRPIESLSTAELEKRVKAATPHKKLYQAELDRRAGIAPEVTKPPSPTPPVAPPPTVPPAPPPTVPPAPPAEVGPIPPMEDPVSKLTRLVRSAKPVRKETELLKHEELRKRAAAAAGVLGRGEAREAFRRSKGMLSGELPIAEFTPPEVGLTPDDISNLFNRIRDSVDIPYFQKLNTSEALEKLLLGRIPTRGDIARLEEVFGTELVKAILAKRPLGAKAWETFLDIWNIPRAVLASWDLSAPLRQGAVLAPKHFKEWRAGLKPMLNAFAKEKYALDIDRSIQTNKYAELRAESGLFHAPIKGVGAKLTAREEVFVSDLARYIPLVRRSERAYITYLNKLRADTFDSMASVWERTGYEATVKDYKELAKFINNASGRGSLGKLEESAPFLSGILFSPRLQASRIRIAESLLTGTTPVRKEVAKTLAAFVGAGLLILALAKLAGAEVGDDPLSADFGKIRIGKTRLDIWGGFQQYARFTSTLIMGMKKSTISGQTYEANRLQIIQQFLRSKLMPTLSFFYDLMAGRTYIGEKMDLDVQQAYQRLAPMFVQDMVDAINSEGLVGGLIASPGVLGVGIVSYDLPNWPELETYFNLETTAERNAYRIANPENEAKLFILGRFTILKTPRAKQEVLKLMEEHKIKPEDIRGYENVFGKEAISAGGTPPADVWGNIRKDLGSSLLKALNRLWYEGGSLTQDEITKLQKIHWDYPLGYKDFNAWVNTGLRTFYENSLR